MQLTISTNNYSEISSLGYKRVGSRPNLLSLALGLPLLSFCLLSGSLNRRRILCRLLLSLSLIMAIHGLTGCAPATKNAAPYSGSAVITGTDTAVNITSQATLNLTIQ